MSGASDPDTHNLDFGWIQRLKVIISLTWLASAFHAWCSVHGIPKYPKLGDLVPNESRNTWPRMHPYPHSHRLIVVRHPYLDRHECGSCECHEECSIVMCHASCASVLASQIIQKSIIATWTRPHLSTAMQHVLGKLKCSASILHRICIPINLWEPSSNIVDLNDRWIEIEMRWGLDPEWYLSSEQPQLSFHVEFISACLILSVYFIPECMHSQPGSLRLQCRHPQLSQSFGPHAGQQDCQIRKKGCGKKGRSSQKIKTFKFCWRRFKD